MWVGNLIIFCFIGINHFPRFDMVVEAPPLIKMWYNDLDIDHKTAPIKYVGALTELLNMTGWPKLIKFLTGYWDNKKIMFQFETAEITPTIKELRDCIDTVDTGLERRVGK